MMLKRRVAALTMVLTSSLLLHGCGDSGSSSAGFTASAGADSSVVETGTITLSASFSGAGDNPTVSWVQTSGPTVALAGADTLTPSFTAPVVPSNRVVVLKMTVTTNDGETASDECRIVIEDTGPGGPSPQGIDPTTNTRRGLARGRRQDQGISRGGREIRTYDGSANNIANPSWGVSFAHLLRLGDADYTDDVSSLAGALRPSARVVSNNVHAQDEGESIPNSFGGTDFVWQWGQFIDHDLDLTDGAEEDADITVPTGDPHFDPTSSGIAVISFSRALFDPDTGTDASNPREQENEITAYIDGSQVYGSDDERAAALRVGPDSPFLKTSEGNLLPFNEDSLVNANGFVTDPTTLFLAGDVRANEQLGLAVMHTLFVREHNRLAAILQAESPGRNANDIFEDARRLVIAKLQIITYEEFLPALIGVGAIPAYTGYDATVDAGIFNEFSVAAFRLGHSMLNEQLLRADASGAEIADGHVSLREAFFTAPGLLQAEDDIDPILRGLAAQQHQMIDAKIITDVRNFLFGMPGAGGFDLASLNIQRGRDHGVPGYNEMREVMGLGRVTDFGDITSDADVVDALRATYGSVDDIDLWVGGLSEDVDPAGGQLGPLFRSILIAQFTNVRDGDRFWYQHDLRPGEMNRVAGTTLAQVIRDNTSIGLELQDNVFAAP
ncbi:MAG: peroxidase family protein [Pseudomonadota bacterium]